MGKKTFFAIFRNKFAPLFYFRPKYLIPIYRQVFSTIVTYYKTFMSQYGAKLWCNCDTVPQLQLAIESNPQLSP